MFAAHGHDKTVLSPKNNKTIQVSHSAQRDTGLVRSVTSKHTKKLNSRFRLTRKQQLQLRMPIDEQEVQREKQMDLAKQTDPTKQLEREKHVEQVRQQFHVEEEPRIAQNIASMFRKHYFDAWAAELRAQRPFVDDQGNLAKLRQDLYERLYDDLKSHFSDALNNWDACLAPTIEQMHEFNCITHEAVVQTQTAINNVETRLQDMQAQLLECRKQCDTLTSQLSQKQQSNHGLDEKKVSKNTVASQKSIATSENDHSATTIVAEGCLEPKQSENGLSSALEVLSDVSLQKNANGIAAADKDTDQHDVREEGESSSSCSFSASSCHSVVAVAHTEVSSLQCNNKDRSESVARRIETSALRPNAKIAHGLFAAGRVKTEQFKPRKTVSNK